MMLDENYLKSVLINNGFVPEQMSPYGFISGADNTEISVNTPGSVLIGFLSVCNQGGVGPLGIEVWDATKQQFDTLNLASDIVNGTVVINNMFVIFKRLAQDGGDRTQISFIGYQARVL